jgi:outer membrane protein assembly factor BamB
MAIPVRGRAMRVQIGVPFLIAFLLLTSAPRLLADDWPHWRGPTRDGLTNESSEWKSGEWLSAKPDWTAKIGAGTSGPLIFRSRVFVLGWEDEKDTLRCLDLATGKEEWAQSYACPSHGRFHKGEEGYYGGPHSTPEIDVDTGLLYSLSIDGDLNCWDLNAAGRQIWSLNLYQNYGVKQRPKLTPIFHRDYGYTTSPLVSGAWVIVEVGDTTKGTYVAFDKRSGRDVWASELKDEAGHTGGLAPITVEGVPCLAGLTQRHVAVIRLDGKRRATVASREWVTEGCCNIATPVVVGKSVLVTSGYNQSVIARFDVDLKGMTEVWKQKFSSKVCSPVVHEGSVYFTWMKVNCLDWNTGEKMWDGGSFGEAGSCILTSDRRVIVYGGQGKLALVEGAAKAPKAYVELAVRNRLFNVTAWPHVVIGGGRVVCRDKDGNLKCFSTKLSGSDK